MLKRRDLGMIGATLLLASGPAAADDAAISPGVAHSTSFIALSPGAAVTVRPLDNTRANLALKQKFAAALKKRSVRVEDSGSYVLNFETEVDQTIRRASPTLGSVASNNRQSEVRVNVWSSGQDSVLRGQVSDQQDRGALRYVLTATLEDERTGRRLWQGEASYTGAPADEATTLAAMASVLADQLGQTVRQKNFRIE
jgi:hypothetical protein